MVSFSLCPCCQLCEHPELGSLKSEKGAREFALIEDSFPGGECKSRGGGGSVDHLRVFLPPTGYLPGGG